MIKMEMVKYKILYDQQKQALIIMERMFFVVSNEHILYKLLK